jgi:HD superfamily phosphohydrolase
MSKMRGHPSQPAPAHPPADEGYYRELLKPDKIIRVAVAGDVLVTKLDLRLIDTSAFQRLRRVRQLGTACYVYPSSLHTRFDHSLGTLAMAARMIEHIRANSHSAPEERTITPLEEILTRLYALLHDVPHIPFGHTLEDELRVLPRHDESEARIHHFFGPQSEIGTIITEALGQQALERFVSIYRWDKKSALPDDDAFIYDIVSNTVCADLLDYLARDNHFCNLGILHEYRFLNFLYLQRDEKRQRRMFVRLFKSSKPIPRRDTITDLCLLLETRYLMAERVYFHHAKITSGAMVGRAVYEMLLSGEITEEALYEHSDDTLLQQLTRSRATIAAKLGRALWRRRLHKQLHKYQEEEFGGIQAQDHREHVLDDVVQTYTSPERRREFEDRVSREVGAAEGDVLIYCPPKNMNLKLAGMKVIWEGRECEFREISDPVIKPRLAELIAAHERLWGVWVLVSPELDEEQRHLVRLACDLQFVTPRSEQAAKKKEYYSLLVDRELKRQDRPSDSTSRLYASRAAVVKEIIATANEDRPFSERLKDSIARHFGRP